MKTLDPKAVEKAARVYVKQQGRNPDDCAYGHGTVAACGESTFHCDVTWLEAAKPSTEHVIRTYLEAAPSGQATLEGVKPRGSVLATLLTWPDLSDDLPASAEPWDLQIEEDAKSGKLDPLFDKAIADRQAGRTTPLTAGTYSHPYEDWRKAINFAIETDEPQAFLKCWNHGEWDVLDSEWPEWSALFPASPREGR